MSTPVTWFEVRWWSPALETGLDSSTRGQPRMGEEPVWGEQMGKCWELGALSARRGPEGPLNLEAQQTLFKRKSLFRLRAPSVVEETAGGEQDKFPTEPQNHHPKFPPNPGLLPHRSNRAMSQPPWLSFSCPLPLPFPKKVHHYQGSTPAKGLAFSRLLVCQERTLPSRTSTKTIRRNDLHFSLH